MQPPEPQENRTCCVGCGAGGVYAEMKVETGQQYGSIFIARFMAAGAPGGCVYKQTRINRIQCRMAGRKKVGEEPGASPTQI